MKKKDFDEITSEDIIEEITRMKIPVLCLDRRWLLLFNDGEKSAKISELEEKVNRLLRSQGTINSKRSELVSLKKRLMKGIMSNMDAPDNSRAAKKVDKSKELIEDINDQLILLEDKEIGLPRKLNEANAMLAYRSLEELTAKQEEYEEDLASLDKWIETTRIELKKRILLREKRKDQIEKIDKYLNDTFDKQILGEYKRLKEES